MRRAERRGTLGCHCSEQVWSSLGVMENSGPAQLRWGHEHGVGGAVPSQRPGEGGVERLFGFTLPWVRAGAPSPWAHLAIIQKLPSLESHAGHSAGPHCPHDQDAKASCSGAGAPRVERGMEDKYWIGCQDFQVDVLMLMFFVFGSHSFSRSGRPPPPKSSEPCPMLQTLHSPLPISSPRRK